MNDLTVTDDHGQQVVEIVGDSSRQPAYRLQFLRKSSL
jgi:hypothetical protein